MDTASLILFVGAESLSKVTGRCMYVSEFKMRDGDEDYLYSKKITEAYCQKDLVSKAMDIA